MIGSTNHGKGGIHSAESEKTFASLASAFSFLSKKQPKLIKVQITIKSLHQEYREMQPTFMKNR
jgi:hypothetical protein